MRVLLATHIEPVIHGQAMIAKQLADSASEWDDVDFHTLNTVYAFSRDQLGKAGIEKIVKLFQFKRDIVNYVRKNAIDAVILTPSFFLGPFVKDAFIITSLRKATSAKIIGWVHMNPNRLDFSARPVMIQNWIKSVIGKVDLWIGCSDYLLKKWPTYITGPKKAIYNGIDQVPRIAEPSDKENSGLRVTYLSAMDTQKGWYDLFEVAQEICDLESKVVFNFYGDVGTGENETKLRELFAQNKHRDRICWHGQVDGGEKSKALYHSDIFVFPSYSEQFPISILEAMSVGIPVVSTDVGGVRDALPGQKLVKPGDKTELKSQIIDLLRDETKRHKVGKSAMERFNSYYTKQAFIDEWHKLLVK